MTDDREAMIKENQRLLNLSRRWRAIAIAALLLVFVVMLPFTISIKETISYFSRSHQSPEENRRDRLRTMQIRQAAENAMRKGHDK